MNSLQVLSESDNNRLQLFKSNINKTVVWAPVAGDMVCGFISGTRKAAGLYGENFQLLIKTEEGVTACWITEWLKINLKAKKADAGDIIALTFLGRKQSPAGHSFNAYDLQIQKH